MVARTVICRQDGRGRFPVRWTISPNVGQTHEENPNLVRILYINLHEMIFTNSTTNNTNIDTQRSVHFAVPRVETRLTNASDLYMKYICRALQALFSPQKCELIKKNNTKLFL